MSNPVDLLIAEDSRIQARMLKKRLEEAGYAVRWAENGKDALDMVHQQRPDLIISDIEMPVMTGYEFCEAVKNDSTFRSIPLILLSTLSSAEDIIQGLHVGADNYITKPYETDFLLSRVADLLSTPLGTDDDESQQLLQVKLAGKQFEVKAGQQRTLNLLVSTFENAVEKNNELVQSNEALSLARDDLARNNEQLATLNQKLESVNDRMTRDLDAAAKVQQSMLPAEGKDIDDVKVAWRYTPCNELAGDFLNFFRLDERHLAAFVVDVSGHGVASSLLSVAVARTMTAATGGASVLLGKSEDPNRPTIIPPTEVAAELNRRFPMEDQGGLYFTMLYGVLDLETREYNFTCAGHPGVVHIPKGQPPKLIESEGIAIGWMEGFDYDPYSVKLEPGDRLLIYSDGVPEAMDKDLNEFEETRMLAQIESSAAGSLDDVVAELLEAVQKWCVPNGPKDDVSILGLEMK